MKQGQKSRGSAKSAKKAADETRRKEAGRTGKGPKASLQTGSARKAGGKNGAVKSVKAAIKESGSAKKAKTAAGPKASGSPAGGSRKAETGGAAAKRSAVVSFSNPAVGNAFKRAVKKYAAAFKRLTD
jgi:hypothetical protein